MRRNEQGRVLNSSKVEITVEFNGSRVEEELGEEFVCNRIAMLYK